jgi:uncharacterized membrane protein YhaH (DUF805 family)
MEEKPMNNVLTDSALIISSIRKIFTYSGRATRREYWTFVLWSCIIDFVIAMVVALCLAIKYDVYASLFKGLLFGAIAVQILVTIPLSVRRLHDIDLSGFWMFYLNPAIGLPLVYVAYMLGIDSTCDKFIENAKKVGSPWLGWILLGLFWTLGSSFAMVLLFLYAGKDEDNSFGESPYKQ